MLLVPWPYPSAFNILHIAIWLPTRAPTTLCLREGEKCRELMLLSTKTQRTGGSTSRIIWRHVFYSGIMLQLPTVVTGLVSRALWLPSLTCLSFPLLSWDHLPKKWWACKSLSQGLLLGVLSPRQSLILIHSVIQRSALSKCFHPSPMSLNDIELGET